MKTHYLSRRFRMGSTGTVLALGFLAGLGAANVIYARQATTPPAYLVVSSKTIDPEPMGAYRAATGPLEAPAGLEVIAGRPDPTVTVLEGEWPYEEGIVIERFRSMETLGEFWYSEDYQEAKKLREGLTKVNFIVAVEGVPAD